MKIDVREKKILFFEMLFGIGSLARDSVNRVRLASTSPTKKAFRRLGGGEGGKCVEFRWCRKLATAWWEIGKLDNRKIGKLANGKIGN